MPEPVLRDQLLPAEPAELELGTIQLIDGEEVHAMLLRPERLSEGDRVVDISELGGFRAYQRFLAANRRVGDGSGPARVVSAEVDAGRLLARLGAVARISASPPPAVTRLAWSAEWRKAADRLLEWSADAGADAWVDRSATSSRSGPAPKPRCRPSSPAATWTPSRKEGPWTERTEWSRRGRCWPPFTTAVPGSATRYGWSLSSTRKAWWLLPTRAAGPIAGLVDPAELGITGSDGRTLEAIDAERRVPPRRPAPGGVVGRSGDVVELHIEQGPVLDVSGIPVGVVTAITGQQRGTIEVKGRANHAGTTPMTMRRDALAAAAELVLAVESLAGPGRCDVATIGRLQVEPGVANVIPSRVVMSLDVRSPRHDR